MIELPFAHVFEGIPSDWKVVPFEQAIDFREGPGILAKDFHEHGVPLIRLSGLTRSIATLEGCNYLNPAKVAAKWEHFKVELDDLLVSTSGTLGRVARVAESTVGAIPYTGIIRMRPVDEELDREFLRFLLESPHFQQQATAMASGSVLSHYGPSHLRRMGVALPSPPEQRAIASILGSLDDKIDLNRRMNETLEAMARAIFKSWFVDFDPVRAKAEGKQPFGMDADTAALFPDRLVDSEIGPIPEGWEVSALGNLCDLVKDKTEPEDVDPETSYVGLEHIPKRTFGMLETGIAADVSSAKARFSAGDTLFGKLRPYFHKVVPAFTDGICSTDILVLRPKSAVHSAAALLTASLDACVEYATQYSTGTRMPRANWKDLAKFPIAMSVDLLPLFARQADTKLKLIARNVEQSRTLAELRDLLLPKLLSGEIRVKDAEKAVEAAV